MRLLALLVALAVSIGSSWFSLGRWEHARTREDGLLSVPPYSALRLVSLGYRNFLADVFYMRFSTYWGFWLTHGRKFHNLYPLADVIVRLDPEFRSAFESGSLALADTKQLDRMEALLDFGAKRHPDDHWFPYQTGMMYFLYSEDYLRAARFFEDAARKPNAPPECAFFAARMYMQGHQKDLAIATWAHIYETGDKNEKVLAARSLKKLGIDVDHLPGS